ncbi:MAG: DNA internalization-related competence protein ComEC/Rec2 [Coprococcus sp.]|nr:DNA internalization-related competence protein ComEC/Rec2 [Coprococcus sp.]
MAVCFALGEAYAVAAGSLGIMIICGMAAIIAAIAFHTREIVVVGIFLVMFVIGMLGTRTVKKQQELAQLVEQTSYTSAWGRVYDIRENGDLYSIYIRVKNIELYKERADFPANLYASYVGATKIIAYVKDVNGVRVGANISVSGKIERPKTATNPGAFNARKFYANKGIYAIIKNGNVTYISESYNRISHLLYRVRRYAGSIIDSSFDESDASVIRAMLLGEKSGIDKDTKNLFQINGIAHILAISGMHIAILGMALYKILRRLTGANIPSGISAIVIIVLYGVMTGMASATCRAVIMMSIAIVGRIIGRSPDMLTSAGVAFVIQCAASPLIILDAGFLLSFSAVMGLAVIKPLIEAVYNPKSKIVKTLIVNISVTVATTPLIVYYYYQIPLYSIILNIIIVPFVSLILYLCIILVAAGVVSSFAAELFGMPVSFILYFYRLVCKLFYRLPYSNVNVGHIASHTVAAYYLIVILVLVFAGRIAGMFRDYRAHQETRCRLQLVVYIILTACLLGVGTVYLYNQTDRDFKVVFMDVGQGDGILVSSGKGTNILIDGGSSSVGKVGEYVMQPVLKYYGCSHIDYAFVTHGDEDHISGIRYLLESDNTGIYIDNLVLPRGVNSEKLDELVLAANKKEVNIMYFSAGDYVKSKSFAVESLNPSDTERELNENDLSQVLMLEHQDVRMLFTGDLGIEGERAVMNSSFDIHANVLKVGHHGSKYSSGKDFLAAVNPDIAIISAGADNMYGHPHDETLERLEEAGAGVIRTDESGAIEIRVIEDKLQTFVYGDG